MFPYVEILINLGVVSHSASAEIPYDIWTRRERWQTVFFIYPAAATTVRSENLVFNANLQEFAQRVSYICNLETAGKLSPEESYQQIRDLWEQLKRSEKQLRIGEDPFRSNEGPEAEGAGGLRGRN